VKGLRGIDTSVSLHVGVIGGAYNTQLKSILMSLKALVTPKTFRQMSLKNVMPMMACIMPANGRTNQTANLKPSTRGLF
jgi:hypothetical protein